jgi:hypothetical protein
MSPHDPVEEFFARERREVRDLPSGPDHWEGILSESRRPARRGWLPYLGAAAAAAVVVGAIAYGTTANRGDHTTPATASGPATTTVTQTVTAPATGTTPAPTPSSGPATTTPAGPLPAPVSFEAVSMSNAGDRHVYAMGSARCGDTAPHCVAVVGSDDEGATWTTRASFPKSVASGARSTPDQASQLTGIRFARPEVGYLYGGTVWRTTDGGDHWSTFDVGGQRVLSLESDGNTVWLVTADSCRHGAQPTKRGCSDLAVWSAPVDAPKATKVRTLGLAHPAESAWLSMDGSDAYVSISYADQSLQTLPQRVSGSPATLPRPKGCSDRGGVWLWGTAKADGHLVAVCASATEPAKTYAVSSSGDRGKSWSPAVDAPDLGTPGSAGVWLTAVDAQHLVAVQQGLPTSSTTAEPTTLLSSTDGGRTWSSPQGAGSSDSWSWAGAAGGGLVYVLGGGPGSFEVSTDSGATFGAQPFRK